MTGEIIDHAAAFVLVIITFTASIAAFNGIVVAGLNYLQLRDVSIAASDLIDNMLLTPGSPSNWGQLNSQPLAFGLQNPGFKSYSLSPFDPLRMMQPSGTILVSGVNYSTFVLPGGETMFQPTLSLVTYSTALKISGLNGLYGFRLNLAPTLNVTITPTSMNPLTFTISVSGPGGPTYNAIIGFTVFYIPSNVNTNNVPPVYTLFTKVTTNTLGQATVSFPFDGSTTAYNGLATISAGGLLATGSISNTNFSQVKMWPVINNISNGTGEMIHQCTYQNNPPCGKYFYNASLYIPASDGTLQPIQITGGTGSVTPGSPGVFQFPLNQPGIVVVGYDGPGLSKGAGFFILPWGANTLGLSLTFGNNPPSTPAVASVRRAALMGLMHYQAVLTLWKSTTG